MTASGAKRPRAGTLAIGAAVALTATACSGTSDTDTSGADAASTRGETPTVAIDSTLLSNVRSWVDERMAVEHNARIPMRDGLDLAANIFRPKAPGKYPVIMTFSAFNAVPPGHAIVKSYEAYDPNVTRQKDLALGTQFEGEVPSFWVPYGYVVIIVDARGHQNSPGTKLPEGFSTAGSEVREDAILTQGLWMRDQYDAIEWAAAQEWSNGNVGLSGTSLLGFSQWRVAGLNPPHLKAIIPWEAMTDVIRGSSTMGGVPQVGFGRIMLPDATPAWSAPAHEQLPKPVNKTESEYLPEITLPTLLAGAWNMDGVHTLGTFRAWRWISSKDKWLYTTGGNEWGIQNSTDARAFRKMFFDHYLKGADSRILDVPRVRIEVQDTTTTSLVRYENEFPIARTQYTPLYLDAASKSLGSNQPSASHLTYDSTGQVTFLHTFDKDTELTGYMSLKLWVSAEKTNDLDLLVSVTKVDAQGKEVPLTPAMGFMRMSLRELDPKLSTPWAPYQKSVTGPGAKVPPGIIVPVEIEIFPSSYLFHKSEKLRLEIGGNDSVQAVSGEPLHTGMFKWKTLNLGNASIYTGGKYDSRLLVPVIPAKS